MLAAIQLRFRPSWFRRKESSLHLKLNRNFPCWMYIFINNFFNRGEPNFSCKKSLLFLHLYELIERQGDITTVLVKHQNVSCNTYNIFIKGF